MLWVGSAIAVNVWYSGGYLSPIGWIPGILLIIIGSFVGSLLFAAAGTIGSNLGIPSMVTVRPSFGIRGSYLMSIVNYVTLIGWTGWMIFINASAVDKVCEVLFGFSGFPYWVIVCGVLCTSLALLRAQGWKHFTKIVVTVLVAISLAINYLVFTNYGWGYLSSKPAWGMPWGTAFDLALIIPLSWAPLAADYMRFSKSTKGGFFGALLGQGAANAWFYITGLACGLAFGIFDPTIYVSEIGGVAFGIAALFVIWLGTITTTFLDIYSANMSIINIMPSVKEWQGSLLTGGVGIIIAFLPWLDTFVQFLNIIGALFIPLFAIILVDYFVLRRKKYDIEALYSGLGKYWYRSGVSSVAVASWVIGALAYFLFQTFLPSAGATMPSFAVSAVLYFVLARLSGK